MSKKKQAPRVVIGRKPRLHFRMSERDWKVVKRAAAAEEKPVAAFIREALIEAAIGVMQDHCEERE